MKTFDIDRELKHLQVQFLELHVRCLKDEHLDHLDEHLCEFEQLMAAVRHWRTALGLPQLVDAD
jgi:hypothetical protein